ncbi:MAG: hypothetical protein FJ290_08025 [Planctomycetes bacterium]|nr:hypothetical protein [Planctomycetota bacterium]
MSRSTFLVLVCMSAAAAGGAEQFVTEPFPAEAEGATVRFDLKPLPPATKVLRAILRVPTQGHQNGAAVRLEAAGVANAEPLKLLPPDYVSFDATAPAMAWVANPQANQGLRITNAGGVDFRRAVLEVSYLAEGREPIKPVAELNALHQSGQTFLTWKEIEDVVGDDAPKFEDFDKAVLGARAKRRLVYRVYRSAEPITVANLGQAELAREVPEVVSCWNLKAIRNTEHPNQGTPTKHSPLRPGYNLALNHVMTRYRIVGGTSQSRESDPLPRATGLAVFTATKPGKRYYAVAASIDGREAAAELACLKEPVSETPSPFPAIVYQRTASPDPREKQGGDVDVYNSWIEPPYDSVPSVSETFIVRWRDLPRPAADTRTPLMLSIGTYGCTATEAASPGWHAARRHVRSALILALSEGGLWQGFHECIGTLRGYDDGVVHNYPQRRVLGAAAWAVAERGLFVDPERVAIWGQFAGWALRHGDVFSAVMSNGHGNLAIGKVPQQHGWKWGPYPKGSKNWLGIDQWEYMNLPRWIRENPTIELPYWLCWPAYGAYPAHTIGDFGFMPWPEMIHAMAVTKRAFAANWSTNGPGPVGPIRDLVSRIRLHQSLPAFTNCSLDHSPGDGDHDDAEKGGGINLYQLWDPETLVDEPDRWGITLYLRDDCPYPDLTTDLTPRRCQKFKAKPGESFKWTHSSLDDAKQLQSGTATADKWGLVTIGKLTLSKVKSRVRLSK